MRLKYNSVLGMWFCKYCFPGVLVKLFGRCKKSMGKYRCSRHRFHFGKCIACGTHKDSHPIKVGTGVKNKNKTISTRAGELIAFMITVAITIWLFAACVYGVRMLMRLF